MVNRGSGKKTVIFWSALGVAFAAATVAAWFFPANNVTTMPVHQPPDSTIGGVGPVPAPETTIPASLEKHLSDYKSRLLTVSHLPLTEPGNRVLYIDPAYFASVEQLQGVWSKIQIKPTVVWVHTNKAQAAKDWKLIKFTRDPLPSTNTIFTERALAVPDAYIKQASGKWLELPGVLKPSQTQDWIKFFDSAKS